MARMTTRPRAAVWIPALALALVAGGWGVPPLQTADPADPEFVKPDFRPLYRPEFERVYRLEKGQALKRLAPPFIPEREIYYLVEHESQSRNIRRPPDYFTFQFSEEKGLQIGGLGFVGERHTLGQVLSHPLGLKSYQYEGPRELLSLNLPGDWVIRTGAADAEKLAALGRIASEAHGRLLHFQRRQVEREVIVATGAYRFTPVEGTYDKSWVHLFADAPDVDESHGGGSGDFKKFLEMIGDRTGVPVIDQTDGHPPAELSWGHHRSSYLTRLPPGPERDAQLTKVLETVSKQTGLKFRREKRRVPVWVLSEGAVAG